MPTNTYVINYIIHDIHVLTTYKYKPRRRNQWRKISDYDIITIYSLRLTNIQNYVFSS